MVDTTFFKNNGPFKLSEIAEICNAELKDASKAEVLVADMATMGKAGDKIRLEIDPKSHPAWTGVQRLVDTGGQISKFNNKFAAFGLKAGDSAK